MLWRILRALPSAKEIKKRQLRGLAILSGVTKLRAAVSRPRVSSVKLSVFCRQHSFDAYICTTGENTQFRS